MIVESLVLDSETVNSIVPSPASDSDAGVAIEIVGAVSSVVIVPVPVDVPSVTPVPPTPPASPLIVAVNVSVASSVASPLTVTSKVADVLPASTVSGVDETAT